MLEYNITSENEGKLLRQYLRDILQLSSRFIKKLTSKPGYLLVNHEPVTVRYLLREGDRLQIRFPEEKRSEAIKPEPIPLEIVYEDEWLLVLHKRAGMPSIPSQVHRSQTVANGLLYYYDKHHLPYTIHIVTRLDKDTSGLMLVAKHQYCHALLSKMQRNQEIERYYEALVHGIVDENFQTIQAPIRRKANSIIEREVGEGGQEAVTHVVVKQRYEHFSHIEARLETGRTHQIRVHLAYIGHPLVGDHLYGGSKDKLSNQALHCARLQFTHPITRKKLSFQAKLPEEWQSLLQNESVGEKSGK